MRSIRILRQALAASLSLCLVATSGGVAEAVHPSYPRSPLVEFAPPARLGFVTDHYLVEGGKGRRGEGEKVRRPLVILIQDLHAHYGVQKNIAGILEFLEKRLSRDLPVSPSPLLPFALAVEGAQGPIDTSVMALFPDPKIKETAAHYLMRQGELSGAEAFAITHGHSKLLMGVENQTYYNLNRELFRKTLQNRERLVSLLRSLEADLSHLGSKILSSEIKHFDRKLKAFHEGKLSFNKLFDWLTEEAAPFGMDVSSLKRSKADQLFSDIESLAYILSIQKAKTPAEQNLIQVRRDLALLLKVSDLRATEAEVRSFGPRLNSFIALTSSLLESNGLKRLDKSAVRELLSSSIDYYALAMMRNQPMVDNTLALISDAETRRRGDAVKDLRVSDSPRPRVAVLVTGGFHTAPVTQLLRKRGVSYVVMTPYVDKLTDEDHRLYVQRLRGDLLDTHDVLRDGKNILVDGARRRTLSNFWPIHRRNDGLAVGVVVGSAVALMALYTGWLNAQDLPFDLSHLSTFKGLFPSWASQPSVSEALQQLTQAPTHAPMTGAAEILGAAGVLGSLSPTSDREQVLTALKRQVSDETTVELMSLADALALAEKKDSYNGKYHVGSKIILDVRAQQISFDLPTFSELTDGLKSGEYVGVLVNGKPHFVMNPLWQYPQEVPMPAEASAQRPPVRDFPKQYDVRIVDPFEAIVMLREDPGHDHVVFENERLNPTHAAHIVETLSRQALEEKLIQGDVKAVRIDGGNTEYVRRVLHERYPGDAAREVPVSGTANPANQSTYSDPITISLREGVAKSRVLSFADFSEEFYQLRPLLSERAGMSSAGFVVFDVEKPEDFVVMPRGGEVILGRSETANIKFINGHISRRHVSVEWIGGQDLVIANISTGNTMSVEMTWSAWSKILQREKGERVVGLGQGAPIDRDTLMTRSQAEDAFRQRKVLSVDIIKQRAEALRSQRLAKPIPDAKPIPTRPDVPNRGIVHGRVPVQPVKWAIRRAIRRGHAYKVWNRNKLPALPNDVRIPSFESSYGAVIESARAGLPASLQLWLDETDIVVINKKDYLHNVGADSHQPARASRRRRVIYVSGGLWGAIKNSPEALTGFLAHELTHIARPEAAESDAEAMESEADPGGALNQMIARRSFEMSNAVVFSRIDASMQGFQRAIDDGDIEAASRSLLQLEVDQKLSPYDKANMEMQLRRAMDRNILSDLEEQVGWDMELIGAKIAGLDAAIHYERMVDAVDSIRSAIQEAQALDPLVKVQGKRTIDWMASMLAGAERNLQKLRAKVPAPDVKPSTARSQISEARHLGEFPRAERQSLGQEEFQNLVRRIGVKVAGNEAMSAETILKDFPPEHKIVFGDMTYFLSAPYQSKAGGRRAYMAYLYRRNPETGQEEMFVRALYKSNSQKTIWRFASHHNGKWIGKGAGEETTDAPLEIQPFIHDIAEPYRQAGTMKEGTGFYEVLDEGGFAPPQDFMASINLRTGGLELREGTSLGSFQNPEIPESFQMVGGRQPDFDGGLIETYETVDPMSGRTKNYRILSVDREVQYLFIEELEGKKRVEIASVQTLLPRMTRFGVRANIVIVEHNFLLAANEYAKAIPEPYIGDYVEGDYYDASNFVELLPPVIAFREKILKQPHTKKRDLVLKIPPVIRLARTWLGSAEANAERGSELAQAILAIQNKLPEVSHWSLTEDAVKGHIDLMLELSRELRRLAAGARGQANSREWLQDVADLLDEFLTDQVPRSRMDGAPLTIGLTRYVGNLTARILRAFYRLTGQGDKVILLGRGGRRATTAERNTRNNWIREVFAPTFPFEVVMLAFLAGPFAVWHGSIQGDISGKLAEDRLSMALRIQRASLRQVRRLGRYYRSVAGTAWLSGVPEPVRFLLSLPLAVYRGYRLNVRMHRGYNRRHRSDGAALSAGMTEMEDPTTGEIPEVQEPFTVAKRRDGGINEDRSFFIDLGNGVSVAGVFDGSGGPRKGDEAAQFVADFVERELKKVDMSASRKQIISEGEMILADANLRLQKAYSDGRFTTATFVVVRPLPGGESVEVFAFNVGNSRAYAALPVGVLRPLTVDNAKGGLFQQFEEIQAALKKTHQPFLSSVQDESEIRSADQKAVLSARKVLSQAISAKAGNPIEAQISVVEVPMGTRILVMSKGVTANLTDDEMEDIIDRLPNDPVAMTLLARARERAKSGHLRSTDDDMTVREIRIGQLPKIVPAITPPVRVTLDEKQARKLQMSDLMPNLETGNQLRVFFPSKEGAPSSQSRLLPIGDARHQIFIGLILVTRNADGSLSFEFAENNPHVMPVFLNRPPPPADSGQNVLTPEEAGNLKREHFGNSLVGDQIIVANRLREGAPTTMARLMPFEDAMRDMKAGRLRVIRVSERMHKVEFTNDMLPERGERAVALRSDLGTEALSIQQARLLTVSDFAGQLVAGNQIVIANTNRREAEPTELQLMPIDEAMQQIHLGQLRVIPNSDGSYRLEFNEQHPPHASRFSHAWSLIRLGEWSLAWRHWFPRGNHERNLLGHHLKDTAPLELLLGQFAQSPEVREALPRLDLSKPGAFEIHLDPQMRRGEGASVQVVNQKDGSVSLVFRINANLDLETMKTVMVHEMIHVILGPKLAAAPKATGLDRLIELFFTYVLGVGPEERLVTRATAQFFDKDLDIQQSESLDSAVEAARVASASGKPLADNSGVLKALFSRIKGASDPETVRAALHERRAFLTAA